MDRKEKKQLALKIAKAERKLKKCKTDEDKKRIEEKILKLSQSVESLDDLIAIDELIQKKFKNLLDI